MLPEKFLKPYNPADTEARLYSAWEESGLFNPDECVKQGVAQNDAPTYSIVLPPPNVTGRLHMGHALMLAIEDVIVRFKRMQGFRTLWIPGTDHAAIATQSVVEKQIKKDENKSRHDIGREELLRRIEQFASESHDTIVNQVKVMGASLDWSREAFTLDEKRTNAVRTVFKKMYDAGLIYRGYRIVNWDPKGQTTISDDEIVYEERPGKLYTFRYSKDFPIPVATTRPETKVGDVAVAVHPSDDRYKQYIGQKIPVEFCGASLLIEIVGDEAVDPSFGTGAVGVTPTHSQTDWEIAERHQLPRDVVVINEYAKMTIPGPLEGKKTSEAREMVVEWLRTEGLLEKEEDVRQSIATAERTGGVIEPLPKLQWFINVNKEVPGRGKSLKELMLEPVQNGEITIVPDHFNKTYFHWIENLRDWCISRQIWYGHRIPAWYKLSSDMHETYEKNPEAFSETVRSLGNEPVISIEKPDGENWVQDPDSLDTWFSSGLWTFSTLGWPENTKDMPDYHPTALLETGYDILFFWVARMILMTEFTLGTIPFKTVYLHGLVRDAQGRKMSKSLGNNMDPLDIAEKFGADAARMALIVGNTPGTDIRISEDKIKGYKHFANKLWNIARFILSQDLPTGRQDASGIKQDLKEEFDALAKDVTKDMEEYRIYLAGEKLYHYVWHRLADELIEESKGKPGYGETLHYILENVLKLLHPFMPFVTEEIYQSLSTKRSPFLMVSKWPV